MIALMNALQAGNRSGTGVYAVELARRLPGLAPDVDVRIAWPEGLPLPDGVDPSPFLPRRASSTFQRVLYDEWLVRRDARRLGADLVHYPGAVACPSGDRPTVVTVHDLSFLREPDWFRIERALYYRATVQRGVRRAARIIAVSHSTARDLVELLRVPEAKIDITPEAAREGFRPASEEAKAHVRAQYGLPERFFLYLGTIEPRKNLVRLIQAFSQVADQCAADLVLAGRWGWKTAGVRAAIETSSHAARIHCPGFIREEDLPALLSCATVFVYPSLHEGFGMPVIEAMACHVPVITSNVSSLPEVAGDAAFLINPYDADALAHAIKTVESDEMLRRKLSDRGARRAAEFSWARTVELTLAVYRKAVQS